MEAAPMKHAKNKDMDKTININLNSSQPSIDNIPVRRKIQKGKNSFQSEVLNKEEQTDSKNTPTLDQMILYQQLWNLWKKRI